MANSERVAIAAHLHVALRRKAGRVTDTDWMAVNDEYAREVLRLAYEKALETEDASLADLADRMALHLQNEGAARPAPVPLVQRVTQSLRAVSESAPPAPSPAATQARGQPGGRYIGGLR